MAETFIVELPERQFPAYDENGFQFAGHRWEAGRISISLGFPLPDTAREALAARILRLDEEAYRRAIDSGERDPERVIDVNQVGLSGPPVEVKTCPKG